MARTIKSAKAVGEGPRPRGRPRGDSRLEEVLSVAAASFTSKGYGLTTLEDVAASLGMTRPALYYYAKSKEDLLLQCYDWTYRRFLERLDAAMQGGLGRDRLIRFFAIYSEVVCDDVSRCFLSDETQHLSPENQRTTEERVRRINAIVADLLDEGAADGSLAVCDKRLALATLFGAFNSLPRLVRGRGASPSEFGAKLMEFILAGLSPRP